MGLRDVFKGIFDRKTKLENEIKRLDKEISQKKASIDVGDKSMESYDALKKLLQLRQENRERLGRLIETEINKQPILKDENKRFELFSRDFQNEIEVQSMKIEHYTELAHINAEIADNIKNGLTNGFVENVITEMNGCLSNISASISIIKSREENYAQNINKSVDYSISRQANSKLEEVKSLIEKVSSKGKVDEKKNEEHNEQIVNPNNMNSLDGVRQEIAKATEYLESLIVKINQLPSLGKEEQVIRLGEIQKNLNQARLFNQLGNATNKFVNNPEIVQQELMGYRSKFEQVSELISAFKRGELTSKKTTEKSDSLPTIEESEVAPVEKVVKKEEQTVDAPVVEETLDEQGYNATKTDIENLLKSYKEYTANVEILNKSRAQIVPKSKTALENMVNAINSKNYENYNKFKKEFDGLSKEYYDVRKNLGDVDPSRIPSLFHRKIENLVKKDPRLKEYMGQLNPQRDQKLIDESKRIEASHSLLGYKEYQIRTQINIDKYIRENERRFEVTRDARYLPKNRIYQEQLKELKDTLKYIEGEAIPEYKQKLGEAITSMGGSQQDIDNEFEGLEIPEVNYQNVYDMETERRAEIAERRKASSEAAVEVAEVAPVVTETVVEQTAPDVTETVVEQTAPDVVESVVKPVEKTEPKKEPTFSEIIQAYAANYKNYYSKDKWVDNNKKTLHDEETRKKQRKLNTQMKAYIGKQLKKEAGTGVVQKDFVDGLNLNENSPVTQTDIEDLAKNDAAVMKLFQIASSGVYTDGAKRVRLTTTQRLRLAEVLANVSELRITNENKLAQQNAQENANQNVLTGEGLENGK